MTNPNVSISPTPGGKGLHICGPRQELDAALDRANVYRTWDAKLGCFSVGGSRERQVHAALRQAGLEWSTETKARTKTKAKAREAEGERPRKKQRVEGGSRSKEVAPPPTRWSCNPMSRDCHLDPSGPHRSRAECLQHCPTAVPSVLLQHIADLEGTNVLGETEARTLQQLRQDARRYRDRALESKRRDPSNPMAEALAAVRARDTKRVERALAKLPRPEDQNWHAVWWELLDEAIGVPDNADFVVKLLNVMSDQGDTDIFFWDGKAWHSVARYALENASPELLDYLVQENVTEYPLMDSPYIEWNRWLLGEIADIERTQRPAPDSKLGAFLEAERASLAIEPEENPDEEREDNDQDDDGNAD